MKFSKVLISLLLLCGQAYVFAAPLSPTQFLGRWSCVQEDKLADQVSILRETTLNVTESQISDYGNVIIVDQKETGFALLEGNSVDKYTFVQEGIYSWIPVEYNLKVISRSDNEAGRYIEKSFIPYMVLSAQKNIQKQKVVYRRITLLNRDTLITQAIDKEFKLSKSLPRFCKRIG